RAIGEEERHDPDLAEQIVAFPGLACLVLESEVGDSPQVRVRVCRAGSEQKRTEEYESNSKAPLRGLFHHVLSPERAEYHSPGHRPGFEGRRIAPGSRGVASPRVARPSRRVYPTIAPGRAPEARLSPQPSPRLNEPPSRSTASPAHRDTA